MPVKIKNVRVLPGGMVACFDNQGKQIPDLQVGLLQLWADRAKEKGFDPIGVVVEMDSGLTEWRIVRNKGDGSTNIERV